MSRFSPGPWKAARLKASDYIVNLTASGSKVPFGTIWRRLEDTENVAAANARLAIAAPELLAACKAALPILNAHGGSLACDVAAQVHRAIALAEKAEVAP